MFCLILRIASSEFGFKYKYRKNHKLAKAKHTEQGTLNLTRSLQQLEENFGDTYVNDEMSQFRHGRLSVHLSVYMYAN